MKKLIIMITALICIAFSEPNLAQRFPDNYLPYVVTIGAIDSLGKWVHFGTGFLIQGHCRKANILITNKHVLMTTTNSGEKVSREEVHVKINTGLVFYQPLILNDSLLWTSHPHEDIAAVCFPYPDTSNMELIGYGDMNVIPDSMFGFITGLNLGQEVLYLGFPCKLGTQGKPSPFVRYGTISNFNDSGTYWIETQFFNGSSGSPVFSTGMSRGDAPKNKDRLLVGIMVGAQQWSVHYVDSAGIQRQDASIYENAGLSLVLPTDLILKTIEYHSERMER